MNKITALCDKIIELDKKRTQGEWVVSKGMLPYISTEFGPYYELLERDSDLDMAEISINHAAKLARALKLVMEKIEPHRDVICRGYECCAYCRTLEGLANDIKYGVEEIFK